MAGFHEITTAQLGQALHLKERIELLQGLLSELRGGVAPTMKKKVGRAKKSVSAATRNRIHGGLSAKLVKKRSAVAK